MGYNNLNIPPQYAVANQYLNQYNAPMNELIGGKKKKSKKQKMKETKRRVIPQYKGIQNGGERSIPTYEDIKNNPFDNNVKIDKVLNVHGNKSNEISVKGSFTLPNNQINIPNFVNSPYTQPIIPHHFPYKPVMYYPNNNNNIINNYQIVTPKVSDDHTFFEMRLPQSPEGKIYKSCTNLKERIIIYNYIRDSLIKIADGELINLDDNYSDDAKNLMSYIKILNLNPYSSDLNPYKNLPDNFMIYNSGFPVIKNNKTNNVELNKNNVGLNLRIYHINNIDVGPIISFNYNDIKTRDKFLSNKANNDIYFYNYIKNEIILKNICSHFPLINAYFVSSGANKNFRSIFKNKINKLISDKREKFFKENNLKNNSFINELERHKLEQLLITTNRALQEINEPLIEYKFYKIDLKDNKISNKKSILVDNYYKLVINENYDIKNNLLIALTEAPNMTLKDWFTNSFKYKDLQQKVKTMVNNGYHTTEVWKSVLFQLYYTLLIMIINGIKINKIDIDNIFIKNISDNQKVYGYWIYDILGLKFYVKNYGYLVLIDSNYKNNIEFIKNDDDDKDKFNQENFGFIKNLFNKISDEKIMNTEVKIFSKSISDSLDGINNYNTKNLKIELIKRLFYLFKDFLHNKLGCDIEENTNKRRKKPNSGDIIEYEDKYAIFFKLNDDNFIIYINSDSNLDIYNDDDTDIEYEVIYNLEQNLNNDGTKFDLKQLLDTYVLK